MIKNPRKLVVRVDVRPNDGPSKELFPECATAVLECGHEINCGVGVAYARARKRMACVDCGNAQFRQYYTCGKP